MNMSVDKEFDNAISNNQRLKSKILGFVFLGLLVFQLIVIFFFWDTKDIFDKFVRDRVILIAPFFLIAMACIEFFTSRRIAKQERHDKKASRSLQYLGVLLEVSFPTFVILFVSKFMITVDQLHVDIRFLLNSPPILLYFIFIILSALQLNFKLCLFAGLTAAVQYIFMSFYLTSLFSDSETFDYIINIGKAFFFLLSGFMSGIVAGKIRESVLSSLKAKNELIYNLDKKVKEKTGEIAAQNLLLREKNKDITDSIIYARRIQQTLLTNEKYIERNLERLRGKPEAKK